MPTVGLRSLEDSSALNEMIVSLGGEKQRGLY